MAVNIWLLDLQLPMPSVPITTDVSIIAGGNHFEFWIIIKRNVLLDDPS